MRGPLGTSYTKMFLSLFRKKGQKHLFSDKIFVWFSSKKRQKDKCFLIGRVLIFRQKQKTKKGQKQNIRIYSNELWFWQFHLPFFSLDHHLTIETNLIGCLLGQQSHTVIGTGQYWASTTVWIYGLRLICGIFRIYIFNPFTIWIHKHKLNIMVIIWMSLSAHSLKSPRNTLRNKVHTKYFCPFFFYFLV